METKLRNKRERIDWENNINKALKWIKECEKLEITPTTTQLQKKFGWTQTVASKVKSFIEIMDSTEKSK